MNHALKLTAASLLLAGLAACGGGATDDDDTTSTASAVTGAYWANNSLKLIWRFNSDGSGEFWQGSNDNQSCRHYQLQAVSVSSASVSYKFGTVKYYIAGSGVTTTSGAALGVGGTYSTNYSVSGSSATIGGDAYVKQSSFSYPNTACSYI